MKTRGPDVQSHPWLCGKMEVIMGHIRTRLKRKRKKKTKIQAKIKKKYMQNTIYMCIKHIYTHTYILLIVLR